MSNIDSKLIETFKMFEEIDKIVKKDSKDNQGATAVQNNSNFHERMTALPKADSNPNILNKKNLNLNFPINRSGGNSEKNIVSIKCQSKNEMENLNVKRNPKSNLSQNKINNEHSFSATVIQNYNSNQSLKSNNINNIENKHKSRHNSGVDELNDSPQENIKFFKENPLAINFPKNKSKPVLSSNNTHYNKIYFSNNNPKESGRLDRDKLSKTSYNSNNSIYNNCSTTRKKSTHVDPVETGDRLYRNAFIIKGKIERKREAEEMSRQRSRTPEISPVAMKIKRDAKNFPERLYPSHKVKDNNVQEAQIINAVFDIGFLRNYESESRRPSNFANIEDNNYDIDIENKYESGINQNDNTRITHGNPEHDDYLDKIYRRMKKTELYSHEHKPKLNQNSLKIAEHLMPSKERLVSKSRRSVSRSRSPTPTKFKNSSNFSFLSDDGYVPIQNKKRSKSPNPSNRVKELYLKGLEQKKKLETLHDQKKKSELEEYKKFSYKPKIITNSPVLNSRFQAVNEKNYKDSENNTKENFKVKYDIYEKNINWKKNIENNNKRLKKNLEDEIYKDLQFKPVIHKKIPENDEKFIMKNIEQIEEYVNRRRNNIQKQKDEEDYKKKIFPNGEKFILKPTIAKEFKLKTEERSRSRSSDGRRSRENSNDSSRNVNIMRKKIKANDFFEKHSHETSNERYSESNCSQNKNIMKNNYYSLNEAENKSRVKINITNRDEKNVTESSGFVVDEEEKVAFVNAINNLHSKLVNFKF